MEAAPSEISNYDDEEKVLKALLDAFGESFSIEELASAYIKAGRDADLAGQILCDMQRSSSFSMVHTSSGVIRDDNSSENPCSENRNLKSSRKKWGAVSCGTVSSFLGKGYIKSVPAANHSSITTKPLKVDAKELLVSELWGKEAIVNQSNNDAMHIEMEEFLLKLLGQGFQLERDVICQALDKCGYNMHQSMEKLIDLSSGTLKKKDEYHDDTNEKITDTCSNLEEKSHERRLEQIDSPTGGENRVSKTKDEKLSPQEDRNDIQKEILVALFNAPERSEEKPRKTAKAARRSLAVGELVVEPPREVTSEHTGRPAESQLENKQKAESVADETAEDEYLLLRRAVTEYRGTMKHYYKAAINAFMKGDHDQANKFIEQGHFFHEKACQADEESTRKIFETKNEEQEDIHLLDLHEHGLRESLSLLKCHLSSLSGIPLILKVIIVANNENDRKGSSRRKLVLKLLEKESIKWTEAEGEPGTIRIRMDVLNPNRMSFTKQ